MNKILYFRFRFFFLPRFSYKTVIFLDDKLNREQLPVVKDFQATQNTALVVVTGNND